ncbi:beta-lactamase family protein [Nonomuraea sp. NBC_01738]|uniref:serine hydrolase domain-containing protein n=1 Tax=Nonomuraea sp. NBC_01738 TaxID=2976003 RepID=UPI002E13F5A2|nr:beta-lactamase family protein [Nonomuraea sp. NBC_01738]
MKFALAGLALLLTAPAPVDLTPTSIDQYIRAYIDRTGLPGAMIAVTKGDKVVFTSGYGHTSAGEPITKTTRMPVASLSKSFTALAATQLAEEGALDLDAPVRRYLPDFTMADPRAASITVRQILNQTSGMSDKTFPELTLPAPGTLDEAAKMLRTAPLAGAPGGKMRYHNPNYSLAARVVEAAAKQPFSTYMAQKVFRPLGMAATTTVNTTKELPNQGEGYVRAYRTTIKRAHPTWFVNGSFGVISTADDLSRWLIAQNSPTKAMRTTQTPSGVDGSTYGMGWYAETSPGGTPMLRHTGWLLTHNAAQTVIPSTGYGLAVVTNTGMVSGDDAAVITSGLVDLLEGREDTAAEPFTMTADPVLALLMLLDLALVGLGVARARRWAARHHGRRMAVRLAPHALPVALFLLLPQLFVVLMNRVGTLGQLSYVWPALFVTTAAAAAGSVTLVATRLARSYQARAHRRASGAS